MFSTKSSKSHRTATYQPWAGTNVSFLPHMNSSATSLHRHRHNLSLARPQILSERSTIPLAVPHASTESQASTKMSIREYQCFSELDPLLMCIHQANRARPIIFSDDFFRCSIMFCALENLTSNYLSNTPFAQTTRYSNPMLRTYITDGRVTVHSISYSTVSLASPPISLSERGYRAIKIEFINCKE